MAVVKVQRDSREDLSANYDELLAKQSETHRGYQNAWKLLEKLVLANGGNLVVPPTTPDLLIGPITQMGALQSIEGLSLHSMEADDGRLNSAELWRADEVASIGTGYAMSEEGLWQCHSWGVSESGTIVETTDERNLYFGIVFEGTLASWFADWVQPANQI